MSVTGDEAALIASHPNILTRIWEPDVHLTLWRRPMPERLAPLSRLDWDVVDDLDCPVDRDALNHDLPVMIGDAGYGMLAQPLADELGSLAARFAAIMDCARMRLRLEVIQTDACRRFHVDNVTARMLVPLVGPGTQWVHAGTDGPVHTLQAGDVGLFKGLGWTDRPQILHRSPPVAATGETRLLFALNPLAEEGAASRP